MFGFCDVFPQNLSTFTVPILTSDKNVYDKFLQKLSERVSQEIFVRLSNFLWWVGFN